MPFSDEIVERAWRRAEGRCECRRETHNHPGFRCNKELVWANRTGEGRGKWEAHHISVSGGHTLSNCEILCFEPRYGLPL